MSSLLEFEDHRFKKIHVVEHVDRHAGFCALITYALNGVRKALENDWLPVVRFDSQTTRYFYDPTRGENVWEYFFEPVMGLSWAQVEQALAKGELNPNDLHHYEGSEFIRWHNSDPDRIATFWAKDVPEKPADWTAKKRALGRRYVSMFIRVKPHIHALVDGFYRAHLSKTTNFGVHIRGTDFAYATPTEPEKYIQEIRSIAARRSLTDYRVFVATDQEQYAERFCTEFGHRAVIYGAARSSDETAPFKMKEVNPYKRGEDVLIDILLLSRCDHILKGAAAVGEYALWFNPDATHSDFALESNFYPHKLFNMTTAFTRLNIGSYGPIRKWAMHTRNVIIPLLTAPLRIAARVLRFAQRQIRS